MLWTTSAASPGTAHHRGVHPVLPASSPGGPPRSGSDLPATVRLTRHRTVLDIACDTRVIGLDPATALIVDGLPPPLPALLDRLEQRAVTAELVAEAAAGGVPPTTTRALLARLLAAGALVDAAEVERAARARADAVVIVSGRGALAVGVVTGLLHSGVGRVHTDTGGRVHGADLGTGYTDAERGAPRLTATRAAVGRLLPEATTRPPPARDVADLVVLADELPDPAAVATLRADGVAHLPLRLRDGIGVVGPLVLPGRTACLDCLDLARTALDPGWPSVAARLVGRGGAADPACATATVGLAVAQVVAAVEGRAPPTLSATLELDVHAGRLLRRPWSAHPDCPCGAARAEGSVGPGVVRPRRRARERDHGSADRASPAEGETIMR